MMKNNYIYSKFIFIFLLIIISSCSKDSTETEVSTISPAGKYKLTAFNTSVPTDLNTDGKKSTNQLDETNCLNDSYLTVNSDNTFKANSKGVEIEYDANDNASMTCSVDPDITGTWSFKDNSVTFTYKEVGTVDPKSDVFKLEQNKLSLKIKGGTIVGISSDGVPIELISDIELIYTKQ
jgi:hypothetical protein